MPRTGLRSGPDLGIELVHWQAYEPGDVILGKVTRANSLDSSNVRLTVRLRGRAKSKMIVKGSNATSIYRGRFNFFEPSDTTHLVFRGPISTVTGEESSWPFSMSIPSMVNGTAVAEGNKQTHSYLPLQKASVEQPLPDIFYYKGKNFWSSTTLIGYVEYYLEAELISTTKGREVTTTATLPLFIRTPSTKVPLNGDQFAFTKTSAQISLRSYRLIPDMQTEKLSFKQRTKTAFGSSTVPKLLFEVMVTYAGKLQLGSTIPFRVRVLPNAEGSSEILKTAPFKYRLASFNLTLKAQTTVICPGTLSSHDQSRTEEYDFNLDGILAKLSNPIVLPSLPDAEPLDIGTMLQILLEEKRVSALGIQQSVQFEKAVYPSFKTYNIQHTHRLRWKIGVLVSESLDVESVSGEADVVVISQSQQQMRQGAAELGEQGTKKNYDNMMIAAEIGLGGVEAALQVVEAFVG